MKFVLFYHSLLSDWNHGNAHFLRGVVRELQARGHAVSVWEPADGWSRQNLLADHGEAALAAIQDTFPGLRSTLYDPATLDLDAALEGADAVLVHEWNDPALVAAIGRRRAAGGRFRLLFHDTHHRSVSAPQEMAAYDLSAYDGVLAFGEVIRRLYLDQGWSDRAWTWHEAADTALFRPRDGIAPEGDLVWIGNWGDGERSEELARFLLAPVERLSLRAKVHGVRYPDEAKQALAAAGIAYAGWLPNHRAPEVFAAHRVTVHVPRRFYSEILPGIPTIRVFEALACGIPLISAPWDDAEGLFTPGADFLVARDGAEMEAHLRAVLNDADLAAALRARGLATIGARHTCAHRVEELLSVLADLGLTEASPVEVA
ncbi:CgeB family protein [Caenispirillum bisanense]|uniref:CgeB family protein n=1 Tax=Caenispirillum bisanense TaxID=414052 RepID=UPI0031DA71F8